MNYRGQFSVVIPTLQRSDDLHAVVELCAAHPLVAEVLVINNAPAPLEYESAKVRVLDQGENIFVNPAWNLGAREARAEYLAIINDDVLFDPAVFDVVGRVLARGRVGIIGPDKTAVRLDPLGAAATRIAGFGALHFAFGTAMFLRRSNYVPIPEEMLIWGGDDWLFAHQRWPNRVLINMRFRTEEGATTSSPEMQARRAREVEIAGAVLARAPRRWWHGPVRVLDRARWMRHRLRGR